MLFRLRAGPLPWLLLLFCFWTARVRAEVPEELADRRVVAIRIAGDKPAGSQRRHGFRRPPLTLYLLRTAVLLLRQGRWVNVQSTRSVATGSPDFHPTAITLRRVDILCAENLERVCAMPRLTALTL